MREPLNAAAASRIRMYVLTKVGGRRARILPKLVLLRGGLLVSRAAFCWLVSLWPLGVFPGRRAYSVETEAARTIRRLQNRSSIILELCNSNA